MIISNLSLVGNSIKLVTCSSIRYFIVLKAFSVNTHYPKTPTIGEVIRHPLFFNRTFGAIYAIEFAHRKG
jgi:hypothetical protein